MSDPKPCTISELYIALVQALDDSLCVIDGTLQDVRRPATMADLGGALLAMQQRYAALWFIDNPRDPRNRPNE